MQKNGPASPTAGAQSAIAVKSSVPASKSKKDPVVASADADDTDLESLSLLSGPRNVKLPGGHFAPRVRSRSARS